MIENLRRITSATDLPVTIDLESGYGDTAKEVGKTIGLAIDAGAVGCNLEDSFPAIGSLRATLDQCKRIQCAREAADGANPCFFINVRADIFLETNPEQHEGKVIEALERERAYADAGADGLFAPGLTEITLIAQLAEASPLPLNIMVGDTTPPVHVLAKHGVARVSHGPRPYLLVMRTLEEAARTTNA